MPITADDQAERNGTLSNGTGFPAVTFQAGFSAPSASAPLGVPVGAELLRLHYTEDRLLAYAYAFEQAVGARKPPASTPALPHEPFLVSPSTLRMSLSEFHAASRSTSF